MKDAAVQTLLQGYFSDFVRDLEEITNIDSGHGDAEGTDAVAQVVAKKLAALGGTAEFRRNDKATHTIVRFKGKGGIRLLLAAHVDTVFAKGEVAKRPFSMDEKNFAYGPGVGDDKATVIQTIYAMKALKEVRNNPNLSAPADWREGFWQKTSRTQTGLGYSVLP